MCVCEPSFVYICVPSLLSVPLLIIIVPHSLQHACALVQLCITCNALQTLLALL